MEDAVKIMEDAKTFCLNIPVRQVKALLCENVEDYIDRFLITFFTKHDIKIEVIDTSVTEVYDIALKKAVDHAKGPYTTAEIESNRVKSIRVFYRNFETNKSTEHIEYVRILKIIKGDKNTLPEDGYVKLY